MSFIGKWFRKVDKSGGRTSGPLSLEAALERAGLKSFELALVPHVAHSIFVTSTPLPEGSRKVGSPRIGGLPDLPLGVHWPEVNGKPLGFVGQFNLAEIALFDKERLLPSSGFLFFFYDVDQNAWGGDPNDKDHWRVLFHSSSAADLRRIGVPAKLKEPEIWRQCRVRFSTQVTVPDEPPHGVPDDEEQYFRLKEYLGAYMTHHQLLGHESPVQDDVKLECQSVADRIHRVNASGSQEWRKESKRRREDWILLLQVDSDENAKMMWGDLGRLYFCIQKQDLQDHRFDRVWMILQCH